MKYYLVTEEDLLEMLKSQYKLSILEADGVDNWEWYMESYNDFIQEFYAEKTKEELEDNDYDIDDCAVDSLKFYEYIER